MYDVKLDFNNSIMQNHVEQVHDNASHKSYL